MPESFLLTEDGGFLLQENGEKILLDVTVQRGLAQMRSERDDYPLTMEDESVL